MKRPQGFDPRPRAEEGSADVPRAAPATSPMRSPGRPAPRTPGRVHPRPSTPHTADSEARKQLRRAKRERKRFEREEVRRFTRRNRRRKAGWLTAGSVAVAMGATLAVAVYSPLLALGTIRVEGSSRIPAEQIVSALDDQLGTPLPLLDLGRVKEELAAFPLIQSYSTESRPPDTLVVRIVERAPVASIATPDGFSLLDPAGVVIDRTPERPPGYPVIDIGGADASSARFDAAAEVLVALPTEFLAQVDTVAATTKDDVRLVLSDGKRVLWGSSDFSDVKAARLPALIAATAGRPVTEYDVSSPDNLVVR